MLLFLMFFALEARRLVKEENAADTHSLLAEMIFFSVNHFFFVYSLFGSFIIGD